MKKPEKNKNLKGLIFASGITQRKLAQKTGIHENLISLIVHGRYIPNSKEQGKIAAALNCFVSDIFGE